MEYTLIQYLEEASWAIYGLVYIIILLGEGLKDKVAALGVYRDRIRLDGLVFSFQEETHHCKIKPF